MTSTSSSSPPSSSSSCIAPPPSSSARPAAGSASMSAASPSTSAAAVAGPSSAADRMSSPPRTGSDLSRIKDPSVGLEERLRLLYPRAYQDETPLPKEWSPKDKFNYIGLSHNNLRVQYKGHGKTHKDAASVRATYPIPAACGIYYFEVRIISKGRDGYMGVGLSTQGVNMNRLPGWDKHSYGYHGDDGHSFCSSGTGQAYGPTFTTNDVIGCGLNLINGTCFYTKNGHNLGPAFSDLPPNLYPTVGLQTPGEMVDANFGQEPFVFDIEGEMIAQKAKILRTIDTFQTPGRHGDWQVLLQQLVLSYLVHHGFSATAERFAATTAQTLEEDVSSIRNRQTIQKLVLSGKMSEAIQLTQRLYPDLLTEKPSLHFLLKVRQFIEMVSGCDSVDTLGLSGDNDPTGGAMAMEEGEADNETAAAVAGAAAAANPGCSAAFADNGNAAKEKNGNGNTDNTPSDEIMEVDEAVPAANSNSSNDRPPTTASVLSDPDRFDKLIRFGQNLRSMLTEMEQIKNIKDEKNSQMLENAFSLLAYTDPWSSPVGKQLDPGERELISRVLNSAILESKQLATIPPLERSIQHSKYLLKFMASVDLGACAFASLEQYIKK